MNQSETQNSRLDGQHARLISLELSDMEKFSNVQGEVLAIILDFPIYVLYILTSHSAQNRESEP